MTSNQVLPLAARISSQKNTEHNDSSNNSFDTFSNQFHAVYSILVRGMRTRSSNRATAPPIPGTYDVSMTVQDRNNRFEINGAMRVESATRSANSSSTTSPGPREDSAGSPVLSASCHLQSQLQTPHRTPAVASPRTASPPARPPPRSALGRSAGPGNASRVLTPRATSTPRRSPLNSPNLIDLSARSVTQNLSTQFDNTQGTDGYADVDLEEFYEGELDGTLEELAEDVANHVDDALQEVQVVGRTLKRKLYDAGENIAGKFLRLVGHPRRPYRN